MFRPRTLLLFLYLAPCLLGATPPAAAADGNRLTHLDSSDPYYVSDSFPKLVTPQWIGDTGVDAVIVLAIDDVRDTGRYETYLRPILQRLKQIDGRAPVSIMTCQVDPRDPQLQQWLAEGLSIEVHTIDHPCPLLNDGNFAKAKATYDNCVDLMSRIPGNRPVAYRMPCCDSQNTVSPRAFAEVFNRATTAGRFLQIDTSVFNILSEKDPDLPLPLVIDSDGKEKFRKYLPADRTFVNTIENYPYPYVIGRLCWEFPCAVPSDWSAQHRHGTNNPLTVGDWKAAVDAAVIKQGTFNLVFHPHGWIRNEQIVELIEHVDRKHGQRVKFLTFRDAARRINEHLLAGHPLRAANGQDNGVRLLDLNDDGYLDVVIGNERTRLTRLWLPEKKTWAEADFPVQLVTIDVDGNHRDAGVRFGILRPDGHASLLVRDEQNSGDRSTGGFARKPSPTPPTRPLANSATAGTSRSSGGWHFDGDRWKRDDALLSGLEVDGRPVVTASNGRDTGVRLRDLDGDGVCELLVANPEMNAVFRHDREGWTRLPFQLPGGALLVQSSGADAGLRFVDVDEDGRDDVLFSNKAAYGLFLFSSMKEGWSRRVRSGQRPAASEIPMIARGDENNGAWFHSRHLWVQNEHTAHLEDLVERVSYDALLAGVQPGPKSPETSRRLIETRPGFRVELVAAEPMVTDPVAFEWGADGKLWVAEMADYPLGVDDSGQPGGRIRYLEDTDEDGRYDRSVLFLEDVNFPNGVLPWKRGVLVTAAPDILYAEDTNGDGRADVRETLFTGFGEGNQQHRVNGLVLGLDNWVHCANGDSHGVIKSVKTGESFNIRGRDLRINPETGAIDLQTGQTQHGRCRDTWGNWFGCNNSNPLYHFVLADQYTRRNRHVAYPSSRVQVSVAPGPSACYPISRPLPRYNDFDRLNRFTSACGAIIYGDDLFGPEFVGNSFVSEPVHNLVHREIVLPEGVTFTSRRADDEQASEFLRSRDNWFRPTMLKVGPDGALYIADMYRSLIEHPQYIPAELLQGVELRAGHDRGRIYRVYPSAAQLRRVPRLDRMSDEQLVAALDSRFGWQRDTARRLLVERHDRHRRLLPVAAEAVGPEGEQPRFPPARETPDAGTAVVPLLAVLAATADRRETRLQALCTLAGLDALTDDRIKQALADAYPAVRRHAVRLAEPRLESSAETGAALLELIEDADRQVRMQLAYTLGEWNDAQAGRALGRLALTSGDDPYLLAAVLSSLDAGNVDHVVQSVMADAETAPVGDRPHSATAATTSLFKTAAALGGERSVVVILSTLAEQSHESQSAWRFRTLADVLDTLNRRDGRHGPFKPDLRLQNSKSNYPEKPVSADEGNRPSGGLQKLREKAGEPLIKLLDRLPAIFREAREIALDPANEIQRRAAAVRLLGRQDEHRRQDLERLGSLLVPQESTGVQSAAVRRLGEFDDQLVASILLSRWKTYGPTVRSEVLETMLSRLSFASVLVDALKSGIVDAREIDAARRERLLRHKSSGLRAAAESIFNGPPDADRAAVVEKYRKSTNSPSNAERGQRLFNKACSICHRFNDTGHLVGPDLAALKDKSPESLLVAVLDPNRAVESKYINFAALTASGRTYTGLLSEETAGSITLLAPEGKSTVLLRSDLEELRSTGASTMPVGLEKDLSPQDLADVIAYIRGSSPPASSR